MRRIPRSAPYGKHEMGYADVFRALRRRATIPAEAYVGYEALVSGALAACGLPANDEPILDIERHPGVKREVGEIHEIERKSTRPCVVAGVHSMTPGAIYRRRRREREKARA